MKKWLIRILGSLVLLAAMAIAFVWLLFGSPLFSDMRRDIVATFLSEQIGQPLYVNDDVSVALGPVSQVYVGGVVIPSPTMDDTALAELTLLEFDIDLFALFKGQIKFEQLTLDGLQVNLITREDGTTSWGTAGDLSKSAAEDTTEEVSSSEPESQEAGNEQGILEFLSDKNASFTSIGLVIDDQRSGFSFDFELGALTLEQTENGQRPVVNGNGSINGQNFEIAGDFPEGAPFTSYAKFGDIRIDYNGEPLPKDAGGGFSGTFDLDTGEIGDVLEVIGLERVLEGSGKLQAVVISRDTLEVETFSMAVELDEGQRITAEGSVEDLKTAQGIDLMIEARIFPDNAQPTAAKTIEELKLTGLDMHAVGSFAGLEFETLLFRTNAFDQGLEIIGPVKIEKIHRTPDGTLAMLGIDLLAGPPDAPILRAKGEILDILQLKDITFEGVMKGAANLILTNLDEEDVDKFGGIEAEFAMTNTGGALSLTRFDLESYGTDLWALDLSLAVKEIKGLGGLDFDVDFDVSDGAQFLSALSLEPVAVGALGVNATTTRQGDEFEATVGFAAGTSSLTAALNASFPEETTIVRGNITSERLDVNDLQNLAASLVQLQGLVDSEKDGTTSEVQPLVLPKETDDSDVQPLVLPKDQGKPSDLLNIEKLLAEADVEVTIDFKQITGQKGVSSVSSELTAKQGKVAFGPLDVSYGGGQFSLSAAMDLLEAPETMALSGSTSGWDFGEILDAVGLGIEAYGSLSGKFNVSGNISSINAFINSMRGDASISMSKGAISTSLLELAGLGIFPWLFSAELRQGYTDITCVVAPVRIDAGKVMSNSIVVETSSVQLVAKGQVDWVNDTIALRAEPRRVGQPLARSAWPFDVTGQLSAPQFKLDVGGSRSRRADGADEMPAQRTPCVPDIRQLQQQAE